MNERMSNIITIHGKFSAKVWVFLKKNLDILFSGDIELFASGEK